MKKKILLLTHQLEKFAGSELVIYDLAKDFKKQSYEVTIGTFFYGPPINKFFQKNDIKVINILDADFNEISFDIVWAQHAPVLYHAIFEKGIKAKKVIFSSLSPYEPLEAPPVFANELSLCLANSEETKRELIKLGVAESNIRVFLNSVSEENLDYYDDRRKAELKNIAIVSNHLPSELYNLLNLLKHDSSIKVDVFGIGNKFELITAEKLIKYDAIITIGRTVQLSIILGIPVYCYDHFGGPGWITKENMFTAEDFNYSGRCSNRKLDVKLILEDLISGYDLAFENREYLYNKAKERYSLSKNILKVLELIEEKETINNEKLLDYSYINKHNQIYIREIKTRPNNCLQIFWSLDGIFSEEQSEKFKLSFSKDYEVIEFEVPQGIKNVRIDPTDCLAYIEIKSIEIHEKVDNVFKCVKRYDETNCFEGIFLEWGLLKLENSKSMKLLAVNEDPQIILTDFSKDKILPCYKIRIEFKVEKYISNNLTPFIEDVLKLRNQIDELQNLMTQLSYDKNELQYINNNLAADLQFKEEKIQAILNSHSWKITAPLRWVSTKKRIKRSEE